MAATAAAASSSLGPSTLLHFEAAAAAAAAANAAVALVFAFAFDMAEYPRNLLSTEVGSAGGEAEDMEDGDGAAYGAASMLLASTGWLLLSSLEADLGLVRFRGVLPSDPEEGGSMPSSSSSSTSSLSRPSLAVSAEIEW